MFILILKYVLDIDIFYKMKVSEQKFSFFLNVKHLKKVLIKSIKVT